MKNDDKKFSKRRRKQFEEKFASSLKHIRNSDWYIEICDGKFHKGNFRSNGFRKCKCSWCNPKKRYLKFNEIIKRERKYEDY